MKDVRGKKKFNPAQHCTRPNSKCYTFSHTAGWCGKKQPRFCGCPYCYSEKDS